MVDKKIVFLISVILLILSSYTSYSLFSGSGSVIISSLSLTKQQKKIDQLTLQDDVTATEEPKEPKTEECPLNGELLTKTQKDKWLKRRPLGIVIENHKDARPQSGLSAADIVYEGVAESGITRFLAIYYCKDSAVVGPVRSARVHFINFLREYGDFPLYAHVGGANCDSETGSGCGNGAPADALGLIKKLGWALYNDLNQFSVPFPNFWRDYERLPNRVTEHTVYTSTSKLWDYAKTKRNLSDVDEDGKKWNADFISWQFIDELSVDKRGNINKISFSFWDTFANDYAVVWSYDKNSNIYSRETGGQPQFDKNTSKPLETKNLIIIFAKESPAYDGYEGGHILYKLVGSGEALIFQNGISIKGEWSKEDNDKRMKFYDNKGKEVSIVKGKVFVELLPIGNKVLY